MSTAMEEGNLPLTIGVYGCCFEVLLPMFDIDESVRFLLVSLFQ